MTKALAGLRKTLFGVPSCSMRPRFMMTMRSATSRASSWSCVTKTLVTWISSCSLRSQRRKPWRTFASSAPKRLVQQQHLRLDGQRPGQRHPLPLPAGQLRRIARFEAFELHELQQAADFWRISSREGRSRRVRTQPEGHVLHHGHVAEQGVVLKDEADAALAHAGVGHAAVVEANFAAPGVSRFQPGDDPQQRRLSGAGRPQQGDKLARGDLQAHLIQRRVTAESLRHAACLDAH